MEAETRHTATSISASLTRDGTLPTHTLSNTLPTRNGCLMIWPTSAKEILDKDMYEDVLTRLNAGSHGNRSSAPPFSSPGVENVDLSDRKRNTVDGSVSKGHNNFLSICDKYMKGSQESSDVTHGFPAEDEAGMMRPSRRLQASQNDLAAGSSTSDLTRKPPDTVINEENVKLEFLDPGSAKD